MATLESVNRLLSVASSLLDHAAAEVRDAKLEPVRENIERIAKALAEVMELQLQIYKLQPTSRPSTSRSPLNTLPQIAGSRSTCTRPPSSSWPETSNALSQRFRSFWRWSHRLCIAASRQVKSKGFKVRQAPNPSIERTCHGRLRLPRHAAHVERYAP